MYFVWKREQNLHNLNLKHIASSKAYALCIWYSVLQSGKICRNKKLKKDVFYMDSMCPVIRNVFVY